MIDYRLLQALAAVFEQGGFEKAAQALHLTQSAVSQRIKQLESQLGQPLLFRSTPPKPTLMGERLLNHLQQVKQMEASLGLAIDPEDLIIRITVNADSLATWLPESLIIEEYQNLRFDISVEDQAVGLRRMKQGEVMACLCDSAIPVNGGACIALGTMRYRALASPDFIERLNLQVLDTQRLLYAPCLVYSRDDALQHRFMAAMTGAEPKTIHLLPSSEGFVKAALAGLGFGMMPELQVKDLIDNGQLVDVVPGYAQDISLYWHFWQAESPVMAQVRQSVIKAAQRHLYNEL